MDRQAIIVAPATPPGEGGVAIIRLSGENCLDLILPFFRPSHRRLFPQSHHFFHGFLFDSAGATVDEIMFVYMAAPRSFTAEDVVELHCHGGHHTVARVLDLCLGAGARLARPGEFSYRAFLNGRLDLTQAEAISDLIHAGSRQAQTLAVSQLEGRLSRSLYCQTDKLRHALALLEAWIDFPEEELPEEDLQTVRCEVVQVGLELRAMIDSYNTGRIYSEGVSLLLVGRPNVGKSSLMNALLGEERAIVTEIPGTTRDLLEEGMVIKGLPIRLIDSAGIRQSEDPVEKLGVERATRRITTADLILLLVDGSVPMVPEDFAAIESCRGRKHLLVLTKSDKKQIVGPPEGYEDKFLLVSVKSGDGLEPLREAIFSTLVDNGSRSDNSVLLTSQRHHEAARRGGEALDRFLGALEQGLSLEFLASDLREALGHIGEITGETTADDILESIFSRFCIGK